MLISESHQIVRHSSAILLIIWSIFCHAQPAGESESLDPLVKIHVFSKQVRLLKQGALQHIAFFTGEKSIIMDDLNNEAGAGGHVVFSMKDGRFTLTSGPKLFECRGRIKIQDPSGQGTFTAAVAGESREYPLPLEIICENGVPRFYVGERLGRYVVDSALAEYGLSHHKEEEAVRALSLIILKRYHHAMAAPPHHDALFCDLTHCQVWRGRYKTSIVFNDTWVIAHGGPRQNLFFHSRCGGKTFDAGVFGSNSSNVRGVRDRLYRDGTRLCFDSTTEWSRTVSPGELHAALFKEGPALQDRDMAYEYNKGKMVSIRIGTESHSFSPETARLKINRVKGWSFLKSNNYAVAEKTSGGGKYFIFKGAGLGHGVGLCQHGALSLSKLGYTRFEIIEHYFPDIPLEQRIGEDTAMYPPYLSYCIFDLSSGSILAVSHGANFLRRKIPTGSVFKIIVSLYLAKNRPDIFYSHTYACAGNNKGDSIIPDRCWKAGGHGTVGLRGAIANSCNLYFASLYDKIEPEKFREFFNDLCSRMNIQAELPVTADKRQWSGLLSGLDSRMSMSVSDYISLVRCINAGAPGAGGAEFMVIPDRARLEIFKALEETFTLGTASGAVKPFGPPCNYEMLKKLKNRAGERLQRPAPWGKTSTVLDGTNRAVSYGIFIGGLGDRGIVAVLRRGNGALAARWAHLALEE